MYGSWFDLYTFVYDVIELSILYTINLDMYMIVYRHLNLI
jgi:hypothetical protein